MNVKAVTLIFLLALAPLAHANNESIVACIDDHPPYQHLGEKPYGTHISALETLAKLLNKKLQFVQSPNFARCVAMLKNGDADVVAGLNSSDERDKFAFYAPFKEADARVIISTQNVHINNYDDLLGKIIGVPRGTTYFKKFDNDTRLNKVPIHTIRTGLELLLMNRIDVIITSPHVVNTLLNDIKKAQLKISRLKLIDDNKTSFGFSKKNKLKLSNQEIVGLTTTAFERGDFKLTQ